MSSSGSRMTRKVRRRVIAGVIGLVAVGVVGVGGVFWSNTESLTIVEDAGPFKPGEALTLELRLDEQDCGPSFEHLYRRTLFGRWQLTHTSDDGRTWERHHRGLLSVGSWEDFSPLPCPLREPDADLAPFTVPSDVSWSPIAACSHSDANCVMIDIEAVP